MNNQNLEAKKLEILQEQLKVHREQDKRAGLLLHFAMVLTGLLYFMFEKHLFLGEAITWGAYFTEWHSALDFLLMFVIVVMSAVFLAWVKHHAYLHFGLYGSIGLIVFTVIGFALFAEFFSSSASQDTKSRVLLANDAAYQATIAPVPTISTPALLGSGNTAAIAKAEQTLARCQANLGKPGYSHCNGDKANLNSLKSSEEKNLEAAKQIAVQTNTANQTAAYERQDKLKAESYNAVIVSMAKFIGAISGTDYKDNIKTAIVLTMLIVAVAFEILHHFLSHAKERAQNAKYGLELELAKYEGFAIPEKPESVIPQNDGGFKQSSIGFTAPIGKPATAHHSPSLAEYDKSLFKYQRHTDDVPEKPSFGFIPTKAKVQTDNPEIRESGGFKQSPEQRAKVMELAGITYRDELRQHGQQFRDMPLDATTTDTPSKPQAGGSGEVSSKTPSKPQAGGSDGQGGSLYPVWVMAVKSGECRPSVDETWKWIQKRIAPKETGSKTNDRTRIGMMQKAFFARAIREGLMQVNPNYTNGGKKYLWIA